LTGFDGSKEIGRGSEYAMPALALMHTYVCMCVFVSRAQERERERERELIASVNHPLTRRVGA